MRSVETQAAVAAGAQNVLRPRDPLHCRRILPLTGARSRTLARPRTEKSSALQTRNRVSIRPEFTGNSAERERRVVSEWIERFAGRRQGLGAGDEKAGLNRI